MAQKCPLIAALLHKKKVACSVDPLSHPSHLILMPQCYRIYGPGLHLPFHPKTSLGAFCPYVILTGSEHLRQGSCPMKHSHILISLVFPHDWLQLKHTEKANKEDKMTSRAS